MILEGDGYREVARAADVLPGDLVVYHDAEGEVSHVAVVVLNVPNVENGKSNIRVMSQVGIRWRVPPRLLGCSTIIGQTGQVLH